MSVTLQIKYVKDIETGSRFLPVTSPNAVVWPNGDNLEDKLSGKADSSSLAAVATSGSYNDLSNTPTIPDVSGKEDKVDIVSASGTTLSAEVGKYYTLSNVGTLAITLPTIAAGTTKVQTVTFYIAAGSTPGVTWDSTHTIIFADGFLIEANGLYEISAAWNGIGWIVGMLKLVAPSS